MTQGMEALLIGENIRTGSRSGSVQASRREERGCEDSGTHLVQFGASLFDIGMARLITTGNGRGIFWMYARFLD